MVTTSLLKVFKNQDYNLVSHTNPLTFSGATITIIDGLYQSNQWVDMLNAIFPGGNGFCQYFDIDWMTDAQALEMFTALSTTGEYRLVPTISSIDELVIVQTLQNVFGDLNGQFGMIPEWEESVSFTGGTMYATPNYTGQKSLKTLHTRLIPFTANQYKLSNLKNKQVRTVVKTEYLQTYYSGAFQYGYERTIFSDSTVSTKFVPEQCGFNYKRVQIVANAMGVSAAESFCGWEVQNYSHYISETSGEIMGQASESMCSFSAIPDTNYPISFTFTNIMPRAIKVSVSGVGTAYGITSSATTFSIPGEGTYTLTFTPQTKLVSVTKTTTITLNFSN